MTTLHLKKSIGRSRLRLGFFLAELALTCFALSPMLQAQDQNTRLGSFALDSNTTGDQNTAIGNRAMHDNSAGSENTATGFQALSNNTTGVNNTATGADALRLNTTGSNNTAMGEDALSTNISGDFNTAFGINALRELSTGNLNTAVGDNALLRNTGGVNTAVGSSALAKNTTGGSNTALGVFAGRNLTTGNNNIDIGAGVEGKAGESNTIRIGKFITATFIGGISGASVPSGAAVFVNSTGQLGTLTSSARFKDEIKPMGNASEAILALRPVSFRYKKEIDPQGVPQFGLVAEEVEKVNPDLVIREADGRPQTVRYEQVNAMLLNEFLKARRQIDAQQKQIDALTTGLQKVSAQLEVSKSAPQTVKNNQ